MIKLPPNPCWTNHPCPKRSPECHGQCLDYIIWKAIKESLKEANKPEREATLYESEKFISIRRGRLG